MLTANLREIQTHGEKLRVALDAAIVDRGVLASRIATDRADRVLSLTLTDGFSPVGGVSRFATLVPGILASYSEFWDRGDAGKYLMRTASLHFFGAVNPQDNPRELVLMHAEPTAAPIDLSVRASRLMHWKYGPHLHIKGAPLGLDRCHLHLDASRLPCAAFGSLSRYRDTLSRLAQMLIDEVGEYFDVSALADD